MKNLKQKNIELRSILQFFIDEHNVNNLSKIYHYSIEGEFFKFKIEDGKILFNEVT